MELIAFSGILAGLVFLIILTALLTGAQKAAKPSVVLIEPLFLIIKAWHLARYTGQGQKVERLLRIFSQTTTEESLLSRLLPPVKGRLPAVGPLLTHPLGLIGEQRLVEEGGKKSSILIGLSSEVLPRLILTTSEKKELTKAADLAGEHGFLTLLVGWTAVHSNSPIDQPLTLDHVFLGTAILEPAIEDRMVRAVTATAVEDRRVLTVLPKTLAEFLANKLGISGQAVVFGASEPAHQLEQRVQTSTVVAEANSNTRYQVVRALQLGFSGQLISRLPGDDKLPIKRIESATTG